MTVVARDWRTLSFPSHLSQLGMSAASRVNVTPGKGYELHAISHYAQSLFLLVIDDFDMPTWIPGWYFHAAEGRLPSTWRGLCFGQGQDLGLVFGPENVSSSYEAYRALVELEPDAVAAFWDHVSKCGEEGETQPSAD